MVDIESPLLPMMSDSTLTSSFTDEHLSTFDKLDDDNNDLNILTDSQIKDMQDGKIDGLNDAQSELFDENFLDLFNESNASSKTDSTNDSQQATKKHSDKPTVVKSSDMNTMNFIGAAECIQTGQSLKMLVAPFLHQHSRYEGELQKSLRYIGVLNNGSITLAIPNLRNNFGPKISVWVRVTRTTIPHGPTGLIFYHLYPIWMNDKQAKVFNGSLFILATDQNISDQYIKIENLVMQKVKLDTIKTIKQLAIYTPSQLDFSKFHPTNTSTGKLTRDKYKLSYSVLHFQIILVDQNNNAYPTDLQCQTEPIYEYDANEIETLSPILGNIQKRKKSNTANNNKKLRGNHTA